MKRRLAAWRLALRWQQDALRRRHELELLRWTVLVWRFWMGIPSSGPSSSEGSDSDSDEGSSSDSDSDRG